MTQFSKFDFEQQMLDTWNVTKDIYTLLKSILEDDNPLDSYLQAIKGVCDLYDLKFNDLFSMYSTACGEFVVADTSMEDRIMDCWRVTDDLGTAAEGLEAGWLDRDGVANALLGAKTLTDVRYQKILKTFEDAFYQEPQKPRFSP